MKKKTIVSGWKKVFNSPDPANNTLKIMLNGWVYPREAVRRREVQDVLDSAGYINVEWVATDLPKWSRTTLTEPFEEVDR